MGTITPIRYSLGHLRQHPLRATLTTLGIVIGVAIIVVFVIISGGLQASVLDTVTKSSDEVVFVSVHDPEETPLPMVGRGSKRVFTEADVAALAELDRVETAIPYARFGGQVVHGDEVGARHVIRATSPTYFEVLRPDSIQAGRVYEAGKPEVVLNERAAEDFDTPVNVGDELTVSNRSGTVNVTVVGIVADDPSIGEQLAGKPPTPIVYGPPDPVYAPQSTTPGGASTRAYQWVFVKAADRSAVTPVQEAVHSYLTDESHARTSLPDEWAFSTSTHEDWRSHIQEVTDLFAVFGVAVSLISLVVGAIGIANIMLVSVAERQREIGVMMAVGAKRQQVLAIFLSEALLLGLVGSSVGLALGVTIGWVAVDLMDMTFVVSWAWLAVGGIVGLVITVLAGLVPAWNASRVDPVDALR